MTEETALKLLEQLELLNNRLGFLHEVDVQAYLDAIFSGLEKGLVTAFITFFLAYGLNLIIKMFSNLDRR